MGFSVVAGIEVYGGAREVYDCRTSGPLP